MSALFTYPANPRDLTWALELVQAYNEHRQVLGQAVVDPADYDLVSGGNAQDKTIWIEMQTWLENYCTSFVNHLDHPNMFTLSSFRDAAGIGSFQVAHGAGRTQQNIIDLQKAFDALRWTRANVTWSRNDEENAMTGYASRESWTEAKSVAESLWGSAWTVSDHSPYASSNGYWLENAPIIHPDGYYKAYLGRHYGYAQISGIPTHIQHSAGLWMKATQLTGFTTSVFDAHSDPSSGNPFIEDTGDEFFTLAEAATASREQIVGDVNLNDFPTWTSAPAEIEGTSAVRGYRISEAFWLLKWNGPNGFAYSL